MTTDLNDQLALLGAYVRTDFPEPAAKSINPVVKTKGNTESNTK
jgi:hypothetical protein